MIEVIDINCYIPSECFSCLKISWVNFRMTIMILDLSVWPSSFWAERDFLLAFKLLAIIASLTCYYSFCLLLRAVVG